MDDYRYQAVRDYGLPMIRAVVEGMLDAQQLDAIVYPAASRRPPLIAAVPARRATGRGAALAAAGLGGPNIANLTGFPDLIVPAGFTGDSLPVGLSFLGRAFSEAEAVVDRVQLRAGDKSAPAAGAYAGAGKANNHRARRQACVTTAPLTPTIAAPTPPSARRARRTARACSTDR